MPQYYSPGVYVEEVDSGPRPIQGVSTSVTGAVGVTSRGPSEGKPVLVTSYGDFVRVFGGPLVEPSSATPANPGLQNQWEGDPAEGGSWWQFALNVKGFFDNGGQQLFVKRVFSGSNNPDDNVGATKASVQLGQGMVTELTRDEDAASNTLRLRNLFGIQVGTELTIYSNGSPIPNAPFTVATYSDSGDVTVTDTNGANQIGSELEAGRDFVVITGGPGTPSPRVDGVAGERITVRAKSVGEWGGTATTPGSGLSARVRPMSGATLTIMADPENGGPAARTTVVAPAPANPLNADQIRVADPAGIAANESVLIQGDQYAVNAINADVLTLAPAPPATFAAGTRVVRMRVANQVAAGNDTLNVRGASALYTNALVELDNGNVKELLQVSSVDDNLVTFNADVAEPYLEGHKIRVIEAEVDVQYRRGGVIEAVENFTNLRLVDDGSFSDMVRHVNDRSKLIDLQRGPDYGTGPSDLSEFPCVAATDPHLAFASLDGGGDAYGELTVDDFVGIDNGSGVRTGIQSLEDIDDISLVLVPGMWAGTIHDAMIRHCEAMKYRFAILDPPSGQDVQQMRAFRAPLDSRFAALYYPWINVRNAAQQRFDTIAPSAHLAGIYAKVDRDRGFHKAPANEVVQGIRLPNPAAQTSGLETDVTRREQDLLNPEGINALRYFPGRGQRVWGARTLSSDSNWRYVNVRRIFTFIERSIDLGTQFVVFEPNDEGLWVRVRQTITNFLNTQWRNGVLEGGSAEEAFFVACDRGVTMTQDDIENGRLICEVGIAPVFPAEFVIFRISKFTADSKLS